MTKNREKPNKQYASYMARKYFSGRISKYQIIDGFPDYMNDLKIKLLYNRILEKPKKSWLFGVSKEKYEDYILKSYEIIEELESEK
tara:strand:+ start:850 stop:1107 length:258 start_codon:yes stop_codon:yes gene_type:complete